MIKFNGAQFAKLSSKLKKISWKTLKEKNFSALAICKQQLIKLGKVNWKSLPSNLWNKAKKVKLRKTSAYRFLKKFLKKLSDSWKIILTVVPLFLIFYYGLGSYVVENIDVKTEYKIEKNDNVPLFKTADGMAFLVRREVDDKMWTPNLPMIFPAYVLDNMPNFQIGVINAVKDIAGTLRYFKSNTEAQNKDIRAAYKLLSYAPNVWIMSRKGKFNLAPSSNSQYRKAANELRKFMRDGIYKPEADDLRLLLKKISAKLQKLTLASEEHVSENSETGLDRQADNLFYNHKGYAFAMWQMSKVAGRDYKEIIVKNDLYEDWVRMSASLQRAAEFSPLIIRNGKADSSFTPNHLLLQNYYLLRAISAAEKIRGNLSEATNAD